MECLTPEEIDELLAQINDSYDSTDTPEEFFHVTPEYSKEKPCKINPISRILQLEREIFGWDFTYLSVIMKNEEGIEFSTDELRKEILYLESLEKGFVPFLLRNRCYLLFPLRSDLVKLKDWEKTVLMLKEMGFPLYIWTDDIDQYDKLAGLVDRDRDVIFHSFNGDNKDGFIKAGKFLAENCSNYIFQLRKWKEGELQFEDVKKLIESVCPPYFSIFPNKLGMKIKEEELTKVRKYCIENHIYHDVSDADFSRPYDEYNLTSLLNRKLNQNKWILLEDLWLYAHNYIMENGLEFINIRFEDFLVFYREQIKNLNQCIFRKEDLIVIDISESETEKEYFSCKDFISSMWNSFTLLGLSFNWYDEKDRNGNLVYFVTRNFFTGCRDLGPDAVNSKNTIFGDKYV